MSEFYTHKIHREVPTKQNIEGGVTTNRTEGAFSSLHFIGDGVPSLEEGFSLGQLDTHNPRDFMIHAGRILAHGIEVILDNDINYNGQPARVDSTITPAVPALPDPPLGGATDEQVWLDVWEFPADDDSQPLEIRWAVRVRDVANPPESRDPDFLELADHHYLHIANIVRTETDVAITDLRRRGLSLGTVVDEAERLDAEKLNRAGDTISGSLTVDGDVAIGTSSPSEKLHIEGSVRGDQNGALRIDTGSGHVDVGPQDAQNSHFNTDKSRFLFNKEIRVDSGQIGSLNEDLQLRTSGTTRLTIRSTNGNVGIGQTSPDEKLHIDGSVRGNQNGALRINTGSGHVDIGPQDAQSSHFGTNRPKFLFNKEIRVETGLIGSHAEDLQLRTSGTNRLTIQNSTGNVGIGMTSPAEKLSVNGSIRGNQSGAIRINTGTGFVDVGPKNASFSHFATDRPGFHFDKEIRVSNGQIGSHIQNLKLCTTGTVRVTIRNNNGNVGIGTIFPNRKLEVNGSFGAKSLNVNGGTTFSKIQAGVKRVGNSGVNIKKISVRFPSAFPTVPHVNATARGGNFKDTFAVTTTSITKTSFRVNIKRLDGSGGWGQSLNLDWMAW